MNPSTLFLAEAASWVGALVPFLAAPLVLLLLWEVVVLLGAILGARSASASGSGVRPRCGPGDPFPCA